MSNFYAPEWLIASDKPVAITLVGAGGTGAEMLDGLARMEKAITALGHPGFQVTVWDGDIVSETNILRQRFLPGDQGLNKAEILVERYNLFFGTNWIAKDMAFNSSYFHSYNSHSNSQLLITCVDKAQIRAEIADHLDRYNNYSQHLWLDTGNGSADGQIILGHMGKRPTGEFRLPHVLDLYPEIRDQIEILDNDGPSCSAEEALTSQEWPINRQIATSACGLIWNLLRHGQIDHHGMFIDVKRGTTTPLKIDRNTWKFMGYNPGPVRDEKGRFAKAA